MTLPGHGVWVASKLATAKKEVRAGLATREDVASESVTRYRVGRR